MVSFCDVCRVRTVGGVWRECGKSSTSAQRRGSVRASNYGSDPYTTLGLSPSSLDITEEEAKAAYRAKVKLCHPDLGVQDPVEVARRERLTVALNEAYVAVLQDLAGAGGRQRDVVLDVFDRCVGEPEFGFVNPLEVGVEHVYWVKLQEIFVDECQSDPLAFEERMRREGVWVSDNSVRWVTSEQYEALMKAVEALEFEGDILHVEAEGWWMMDCLGRARRANLI